MSRTIGKSHKRVVYRFAIRCLILNYSLAVTTFGEAVLPHWGFTEDFVRVVELHGGPKYFKTTSDEILIINLANMLTRKIGYSLFEDDELELSKISSAIFPDMDDKKLQAFQEEVKEIMQTLANVY